jgi:nicotinate-nucleotide adenylyltransferase
VHNGHLALARLARERFGYDRVILTPAWQSPLKAAVFSGLDPKKQAVLRLQMLAAAIEGDKGLTIDAGEIKREGLSYTYDTLKDLMKRYICTGKPGLILGDDLAANFYRWKKADKLADKADIIVARRMPGTTQRPEEAVNLCCADGAGAAAFVSTKDLENERWEVSSAQIRALIAQGGQWRHLVPPGAARVIAENALYGCTEDSACSQGRPAGELGCAMEAVAREMLGIHRFLHSRAVALLAWDLCRRFGLDEERGYLAGICHDLCKALTHEDMRDWALRDGAGLSALEEAKPGLLHGRAAAVMLERRFGIGDADVLEAVRWHTIGKSGMGPLAKVVYAADKIEPGREEVSPELRAMAQSASLEALFHAVLTETVSFLTKKDFLVSEDTLLLLRQ